MIKQLAFFTAVFLAARRVFSSSSAAVSGTSSFSVSQKLPSYKTAPVKLTDALLPVRDVVNVVHSLATEEKKVTIRLPFASIKIDEPFQKYSADKKVGGISLNDWLQWAALPDLVIQPIASNYERDNDPKGINVEKYRYSCGSLDSFLFTPKELRSKVLIKNTTGLLSSVTDTARKYVAFQQYIRYSAWGDLVTIYPDGVVAPYSFILSDAHPNYTTILGEGRYYVPVWWLKYVDSVLLSRAGTDVGALNSADFVGRVLREEILPNLVNINLPNFWVRANCGWQNPHRSYYCPPLIRSMVAFCFYKMALLGRSYNEFPHLHDDDVRMGANKNDGKIMPANVRPDGTISIGVTDYLTPLFSKMFIGSFGSMVSDKFLKNFVQNLKRK